MLLGKRPRPPVIRRTTSMSRIAVDLNLHMANNMEPRQSSDKKTALVDSRAVDVVDNMVVEADCRNFNSFAAMVTPRATTATLDNHPRRYTHRTNSAEFIETAHFLRTCALCKCRLLPGQDIYMYRGDAAFCSLECREQRMKQDEIKDKSSKLAPSKNEGRLSNN